ESNGQIVPSGLCDLDFLPALEIESCDGDPEVRCHERGDIQLGEQSLVLPCRRSGHTWITPLLLGQHEPHQSQLHPDVQQLITKDLLAGCFKRHDLPLQTEPFDSVQNQPIDVCSSEISD